MIFLKYREIREAIIKSEIIKEEDVDTFLWDISNYTIKWKNEEERDILTRIINMERE